MTFLKYITKSGAVISIRGRVNHSPAVEGEPSEPAYTVSHFSAKCKGENYDFTDEEQTEIEQHLVDAYREDQEMKSEW